MNFIKSYYTEKLEVENSTRFNYEIHFSFMKVISNTSAEASNISDENITWYPTGRQNKY